METLIVAATRGFILLLAFITLLDYLRHRDGRRRDVFLMFASLGAGIALQEVANLLRLQTPWLRTASTIAPMMRIRLKVSRWQRRLQSARSSPEG